MSICSNLCTIDLKKNMYVIVKKTKPKLSRNIWFYASPSPPILANDKRVFVFTMTTIHRLMSVSVAHRRSSVDSMLGEQRNISKLRCDHMRHSYCMMGGMSVLDFCTLYTQSQGRFLLQICWARWCPSVELNVCLCRRVRIDASLFIWMFVCREQCHWLCLERMNCEWDPLVVTKQETQFNMLLSCW